ncbi:30S ribosomal protein S16 [Gloeomargaritaceae cyanobacterium AH-226-B11]|jgi:small subunit ribosomal protein S16|nr:30S ribosomal protein S16 [Gloeomargaritaceae cyanobacterium AH-226-B11]
MLKLRLARIGRKKQPVYRLVVMPSTSRRNGRPVASLGYYNPITKQAQFNIDQIKYWLKNGVKPTETVANLLKKIEKK